MQDGKAKKMAEKAGVVWELEQEQSFLMMSERRGNGASEERKTAEVGSRVRVVPFCCRVAFVHKRDDDR
jgi:hypothetical protein